MGKVKDCRMCHGTNLYEFLDLGYHPHSDQFRRTNDEPEVRYPLKVLMCRDCGLAQLSYIVEPITMYTEDYLYEASITKTADKHWGELADDVINTTGIRKGYAIDIGGNDGTLSKKFQERHFDVLNVDPCYEVTELARSAGVPTITAFFSTRMVGQIPKADIITGTNVFAHVNDLDDFIEGIKAVLKENGVFVFESPYFLDFLDGLEYDTVYHQHLSYLSLKPLIPFLKRHGMEIFDVRRTELHGGGFRVYIAKIGERQVKPIVTELAEKEKYTEGELKAWGEMCKKHRDELFELVYNLYKEGKVIACASSPAKGQTLLNYTGIGRYISFVTEKSKLKIGRYTPGTKIEIVGDEELAKADYAIILAWNFAKEIMENNYAFKGTWIVPLPEIKLYPPRPAGDN